MSRTAAKNCKWCQDRPGGCLYCVGQLQANNPEKRDSLLQMIQSGDVAVIEVLTSERYLVHHVKGIINGRLIVGHDVRSAEPGERLVTSSATKLPCIEHLWQMEAGNLRRRHCTRPGCSAVEVWRWLPASPDKSGEWGPENLDGGTRLARDAQANPRDAGATRRRLNRKSAIVNRK